MPVGKKQRAAPRNDMVAFFGQREKDIDKGFYDPTPPEDIYPDPVHREAMIAKALRAVANRFKSDPTAVRRYNQRIRTGIERVDFILHNFDRPVAISG